MTQGKQHGPVIELNRIQVKRSRGRGKLAGPDGLNSVFGQMCSKWSILGQEDLLLPHRVWKVRSQNFLVYTNFCKSLFNMVEYNY